MRITTTLRTIRSTIVRSQECATSGNIHLGCPINPYSPGRLENGAEIAEEATQNKWDL